MHAGREPGERGQFVTMNETYQLQKIMFAYKKLAAETTDLSIGPLTVYDSNGDVLGIVDRNGQEVVFYPNGGK